MSTLAPQFEARKSRLRAQAPSSAGALFVVALIFLLLGLTALLSVNYREYQLKLRAEWQFAIYLRDDTAPGELYRISQLAEKMPGFAILNFRDRNEAYLRLQEMLGSEALPYGGFNPLPDALVLRFEPEYATSANFSSARSQLDTLRAVESINYNEEELAAQEPVLELLDLLATFVALLVFAAAVILCYWAIAGQVMWRSAELKLKRELGASRLQLGLPVMIEGGLLGIGGAVVSLLLLYLLWQLVKSLPLLTTFINLQTMITLPLAGLLAGVTASYFALRRVLQG
ncbi:MAG: permease-like cell division protein FtsX [bacterium]